MSASLIANALERKGHGVRLVDVYEGTTDSDSELNSLPKSEIFRTDRIYAHSIPEIPPSSAEIIAKNGGRRELIGPGVLTLCKMADIVYIGLHGDMGENGMLQATLDNLDIKYTGSGYVGSLIAMDKDISKRVMSFDGIDTAPWKLVGAVSDTEKTSNELSETLGLPLVVKPCSCGSSVGVSIADTKAELAKALSDALAFEDKVIVEKKICGREFTVSVVGEETLPPVEIIPKSGFYDYRNKYKSGLTEEICPAELTSEQSAEISRLARAVFRSLRLENYARIDFILSRDDGKFYCLEANTLPGMTPQSLLPAAARAVGIGYDDLCNLIVKLAKTKKGRFEI